MIRADELREFRPSVRYPDGKDVTLELLQIAIETCAKNMDIPVAFRQERIKTGRVFNSSIEDCIVMFHPEHEKDYLKFCIRIKRQGAYAFVLINDFGISSQGSKAQYAEAYKADRVDMSLGQKACSTVFQMLTTAGKNQAKLEEEQMYYQCIMDIFDEIVS